MKTPHIVVIGGGFGGLAAVKALVKSKNLRITLIDKRNYHLFQPLLYQVAMAGLSPAEIAYPLRSLLASHDQVEILLGEVKEINKEEKWIQTDTNKIHFDYLILACGSTYTYFNSPQWEPFAPGLKNIMQATEIRRRVFLAFEKAERETDKIKQEFYTTFVVVGGGPTGVELAGTLGEITRYSILRDFDHIKPQQTKIILIEAGPKILPTMTEELSREAVRELGELGVEVRVNSKVSEINENGIKAGDEFIESATILWAAGVAANPLNKKLGVELDRQGRIIVNRDLSVPGHSAIFVIGDQAHYEWGAEKKPLPGLAPVAMQQGRFVAKYIRNQLEGRKLPEFRYVDKGQMATVGRSRAVAMYKDIEIHGFVAWMAWLFVHIYYLIGFKNRLFVLFQWAWMYLTNRRGARLIIEKE
ncbi:NAD(P)/FAD-dependent oxidoreductase [Peredibacter starrii]|uniref:NADH:ubiquinone reductase (non-electrogenic) n=1 Tax=Peredibacter starrii TaxID=28202 RepID=A0AAX4HRS5_9BACT|nr:NAD(P)/FAD-dependent oxidoreductase [Peredibacter starrii]WPU65999.1 NAD(P)/FAD-dependent oxidoreductase [Peredibacter starrii]